jgi:hypothetical protein
VCTTLVPIMDIVRSQYRNYGGVGFDHTRHRTNRPPTNTFGQRQSRPVTTGHLYRRLEEDDQHIRNVSQGYPTTLDIKACKRGNYVYDKTTGRTTINALTDQIKSNQIIQAKPRSSSMSDYNIHPTTNLRKCTCISFFSIFFLFFYLLHQFSFSLCVRACFIHTLNFTIIFIHSFVAAASR